MAAAEAPGAALAARRGCGAAGEPDPPPVLILSHFCPRPFVCFGALRPGASRALPLAVLNPNAEPAAVALPRGPAAERGFLVRPRAFRLQPKEKTVVSVVWTPVAEGRVREVLTFVVNDILKHEVIVLGHAEEPRKKKRSLWDTMKKKKPSAPSGHRKRTPSIRSVNQTFSVPPKADRGRSPLQACENLGADEGRTPAASRSLILQEDEIPISPISPALEECHGDGRLPLCVRRSTTYTSLQAPVGGQPWAPGGAPARQELAENVTPETSSLDSWTDDVAGPTEEAGKRVLTPSCPSPWGVRRSHGDFLSPDSFLRSSRGAGDKPAPATCVSPDVSPKGGSRPRHVEPDTTHGPYRAVVSPDSFLRDSRGPGQKLEPESANPFVSPNQFVRENMPHLSAARLSKENPPRAPPSPPGQKENEGLPLIPGSRGSSPPEATFEEPAALEAAPDRSGFARRRRPGPPAAPAAAGPAPGAQPPRRPLLSATVTKPRAPGSRPHGADAGAPRARRSLRVAVGGGGSPAGHPEAGGAPHPPLPVIDPAGSSSPGRGRAPPSPRTSFGAARKRKSGGSGEDARGAPAGHPEGRASKRTHLCPPEPRTSTARKTRAPATPGLQGPRSGRRSLPGKRADSLAFKTPSSKTHRRTPRVVPVAQASLTFIKRLKTDIPRHPMPFAAKNMFYDERWKEKQQLGLTWWLNFLLTPDDLAVETHVPEVNAATLLLGAESHHKPSVARAPTKEEASLRAYTARRRLNRLRHAACRLFAADGMVQAVRRLEREIAARRLAVRRDRRPWKDVGERQKVLNWLLAYNPLWLRIGLETVFGELIALEDNSDVTGLAVFILSRLLWNPDIAAEYRHPSVPHLYRDGHEEALSAFTLKKFVLLVCFLDRAKLSRLIDHDPCLFCKDAEFKASRDVLLAFSRSFLSGEGDLCRHLSGLGLPVSHAQTPLDEFDFAVTNLAVDLQCGVRLVRAVELLTGNWGLSRQLRMPAVSRLQKVHNVHLALQALRARGVSVQDEQGSAILAKDIVDRHREKTLALLWRMALAFQVDIAVSADELQEEIGYLKRAWRAGKGSPAPSRRADAAPREQADRERPESVRLLLEWARAVCAFYGARVDNFTVSFSDGRVLCYLIHHYHPRCVPLAAVRQRTSQTVECAQSGSVVLNSSSESEDSGLDLSLRALELRRAGTAPAELHRELLENERRNFQLVRSAARDLGGIPAMVQHADMSNTIPDEKVVITYLSFLCARLLDLRRESRAARRIQAAWREHRLRAERRRRQERDRAASVIQAAVRGFLVRRRRRREARAALAVQRRWRALCRRRAALRAERERRERARNQAATVIQSHWRRHSARRRFLRLRHCAVVLQARRRMVAAVTARRRRLRAAVTIQRRWRACVRRRRDQRRYRALRAACLVVQAAFRRRRRRRLRARTRAAATLQRAFRAWRARRRAREERAAAAIQAWYRARRAARRYRRIRACAVVLQARFRGLRARRLYRRRRASVLAVQRRWRALLRGREERARFLQAREAAVRLQAHWRRRRERARFLSLREAAVRLQALVRGRQQLRRYREVRRAALVIQARFRARAAARGALAAYREARAAALVLQAAWRGLRARRTFLRARSSAVTIQSHYRAHVARRSFLRLRRAAVALQAAVRMRRARARFLRLRAAALATQRRFRALRTAARARGEYRRLRAAAVTLQAFFRMRAARRRFLRVRRAALVIQRHYRARQARLSRRRHRQVLGAATRLQAAFRGHRARQLLRRQAAAARTIQAAFRGHRARQLLRLQSSAARTIQAAFRGHRARTRFRAVLRAAVTIQRWYRARTAARDRRARAAEAGAAALTLQAAFRGWQVRAQVRRERQAARRIQAAFRAARARRRVRRLRAAALVLQAVQARLRARTAAAIAIQRWFRRAGAARRQRRDYLRLREAAVRVQAAFRGLRARRQLQRMRWAAAAIQAAFRMHRARDGFRRARAAAVAIQRRYRGRAQRARFLAVLRAVRVLQASWRGARARRALRRARRAAVLIQRCYRRHRARSSFLQRRRRAAVTLQAAARGWLVRKRLREMHRAAALLQAAFRTHRAQAGHRALQQASVLVQQRDPARRAAGLRAEECAGQWGAAGQRGAAGQWGEAGQRGREESVGQGGLAGQRGAAEVLPATPEGAKWGRRSREQLGAAGLTRRAHRRHRQRLPHQPLRGAPTVTRERHRANGNGALGHRALEKAAACAQAGSPGPAARERSPERRPAAGAVQPRLRGSRTRTRSLHSGAAVAEAQRRHRGAPGLPSPCRGLWGPGDPDRRPRATTLVQAWRPMPRARAACRPRRRAAAAPQSRCGSPRGGWALGQASEGAGPPASRGDGAGAQQDAARSPAARPRSGPAASPAAPCTSRPALRAPAPGALGAGERAARRRRAVVPLPLALWARWARWRVLPRRGAAGTGQNRRRAHASAKLRRRARSRVSSTIVIQAWARGLLRRRRLQEAGASALTIQAAWRGCRARRQVRAEEAACRIQAWVRGWRARREYWAVLKAVRAVQGRFRARRARARFLSVRAAAVTIQRRWRAALSARRAREQFLVVQTAERRAGVRLLRWAAAARRHLAAARIQRAYRRHTDRRLRAAICIQRWFRARLRLQRFTHIHHSIVALQRQAQVQARGRQQDRAASVIQAAVRRFLLRRRRERLGRAAVTIQAVWRGPALRRRSGCARTAAIGAGAAREEDRLCRRTALALRHLLARRHLSAVLEALRHLEMATRLSPRCCEDLARSGALQQLFLLIRSCNRSVPCMEVVSYAVQVLLHVAKYERTVAAVSAVDGCVDTLLGLLRMYREKPGDRLADKSGGIFTRTCCLLAVLLRAAGPAAEAPVRSQVAGCVSSIYRLTAQKHRPSHNAPAGRPRLSESPAGPQPVVRLQPDWVLRREGAQEITTPLQAAQLLMDTLGLPSP